MHSRLDYGNGVLVGIPAHLMRPLQSVLYFVLNIARDVMTSPPLPPGFVFVRLCLLRFLPLKRSMKWLYQSVNSGSGFIPLNSPGGSTLQLGAGPGFLCLAASDVVKDKILRQDQSLNYGRASTLNPQGQGIYAYG